ncbi:hypothetical protein SISNIDRAFT_524542 [Sistotremastrum niveocremeum HHB9708]|uniref:Uncharacterized protein n=1 Tax=Sistotremastrum niveocremeum HHB9708 TaxID=1314777 RepID=A0A164QZQ5_9AGAM|nr:hypothetical protein SISNIDRAFT_524542 [Sistotremastrum niveocremeum HHB9708]
MKLAPSLTLLGALYCVIGQGAASEPPAGSIGLFYPTSQAVTVTGTKIQIGETVNIGIEVYNDDISTALAFNTSMTALLPNGTTVPIFHSGPDYEVNGMQCAEGDTDTIISGPLNISLAGTYAITWNLTYFTSANTSQVNRTFCGPGPFTAQTWLLTQNITAAQGGHGESSNATTPPAVPVVTETLPSKPTSNPQTVPVVNNVNGDVAVVSSSLIVLLIPLISVMLR